ncbi:MAG: hypothetical protein ACYDD1_04600, partial [Caulobacteraceae bacterium]
MKKDLFGCGAALMTAALSFANPVAAQTAPPAAPSSSGGQNAAPLLSSPAAQAPEASQAPDAS